MYPVLSSLRRAPHSVIYVRKEHLLDKDGLRVPTQSKVAFADVSKGTWERGGDGVPVYLLKTPPCRSREAAAVALTAKENELSESLQLLEETYTVILGEELEALQDGMFTRSIPIGIVSGTHRWPDRSGPMLPALPAKKPKHTPTANLPPGVIHEIR